MSQSVVLLSGGLDSAVSAALEVERGQSTLGLFVDYGQLARRRERHAGRRISHLLNVPFEEVRVTLPRPTGLGNRRSNLATVQDAFVRARNLLFITLATVRLAHDGGRIVVGATSQDSFIDTKEAYFKRTAPLLTGADGDGPVEIVAPLGRLTKLDVVRLAELYGIPLEMTWSCYLGGKAPCGRCLSCLHLKQAVAQDPLDGWLQSGEPSNVHDLDEAAALARRQRATATEAQFRLGSAFLGPMDVLVDWQVSAASQEVLKRIGKETPTDRWVTVYLGQAGDGRTRVSKTQSRRAYEVRKSHTLGRHHWERRAFLVSDSRLLPVRAALIHGHPRLPGDGQFLLLDLDGGEFAVTQIGDPLTASQFAATAY